MIVSPKGRPNCLLNLVTMAVTKLELLNKSFRYQKLWNNKRKINSKGNIKADDLFLRDSVLCPVSASFGRNLQSLPPGADLRPRTREMTVHAHLSQDLFFQPGTPFTCMVDDRNVHSFSRYATLPLQGLILWPPQD